MTTPPLRLTIAAGPVGGGYHAMAQRYKTSLAKRGITLTVLETSGAQENLNLISGGSATIEAALVQGGLGEGREFANVSSIGRHFFEPLMIFTRAGLGSVDRLHQFQGRRIAIGAMGTGTQLLSLKMLAASGVDEGNATFLSLSSEEARDRLLRGEIDAAMFVIAIEAPMIRELVRSDVVRVVSLARASAFARQFPYLTLLSLPEGSIDLSRNLPPHGIEILAPTAAILVRNDVHPALVNVLAEVVSDAHRGSSMLGTLPKETREHDPEYQLAEPAQRYFRQGVPFLHRHLPFWVADFVEHALVLGLPLIAVVIPVVGGLAKTYDWYWRSKIRRWARQLIRVQSEADQSIGMDDLMSIDRRVSELIAEMRMARLPSSYADDILQLIEQAHSIETRAGRRAERQLSGPLS